MKTKTTKILGAVVLCATLLAGCGEPREIPEDASTGRFKPVYTNGNAMTIYKDVEEGCKYLFINDGYAGGLSPMYKSDGTVMCEK